MKRFFLNIAISLFFGVPLFAQTVPCKDLEKFIINNGYSKGSVDNWTLSSSWLKKVAAYSYDNKLFVVAEIKEDDFGFNTRTYIFCNIPTENWDRFRYGIFDPGKSFGERFHKYIFDYKCNCRSN